MHLYHKVYCVPTTVVFPPHHVFCYLFQGEGGPAGPAGPAGARGIPVSKIPSTSPVSKT